MKKLFEIIGLFSLACFSFFYTSQISSVIKNNDSLYIQIKDVTEQYKIEPIDAKIVDNTIIPGINGSKINIDKSYKKMKKLNSFNDNLLVYEDVKPKISIKDIYDKYIISGNKTKKQVSLIFVLEDDDNIEYILNILNEYEIKATFFTDGDWFENNNELIINIIESDHNIGNLGYSHNYNVPGVFWMNSIVKVLTEQKDTYCYNLFDDQTALDLCSSNKSYTIRPNIITKNNPLIEIKEKLTNGSIISLEVNDITLKQLPFIIEYINSKGLDLVNIETLIEE